MKRTTLRLMSILLLVAAVAAACGDDDDTSGEASSPDAAADAAGDGQDQASGDAPPGGGLADDAVHGTGAQAFEAAVAGDPVAADEDADPVVITFSNLEGSPAGSFPEVREGMEAAVQQINEQLGGVDGRPIELISCVHGLDPSEATNCANQVVDEGATVHVNGLEFLSSAVYPVVRGAGIPVLNVVPILIPDVNTEGVYSPNQGTVAFPGDVAYMIEEMDHDRIAVISALPLGPDTYEDITERALEVTAPDGVEFDVFEHQAGDPSDDAAMVQAINDFLDGAENPAIFFPEQASDCDQHLNDLANAGVEAGLYMADACNDESVLANPNAVGATFTVVDYLEDNLAAQDPFYEFQIDARDAAFDALPVEAPRGSFMTRGYRVGILLWTVLNQMAADGADIDDTTAVTSAIDSIESVFSFGSPPIDCANTSEEYPGVCLSATTFGTWDGEEMVFEAPRDGEFVNYLDVLEAMASEVPRGG